MWAGRSTLLIWFAGKYVLRWNETDDVDGGSKRSRKSLPKTPAAAGTITTLLIVYLITYCLSAFKSLLIRCVFVKNSLCQLQHPLQRYLHSELHFQHHPYASARFFLDAWLGVRACAMSRMFMGTEQIFTRVSIEVCLWSKGNFRLLRRPQPLKKSKKSKGPFFEKTNC